MEKIEEGLIKEFAKKLDDQIKLNGIAELLDGPVLKACLVILNDKFAEKIPEEYGVPLVAMMEAYVSGDVDQLTAEMSDAVNVLVDLPQLNEEDEGVLIGGILQTFSRLVFRNAA